MGVKHSHVARMGFLALSISPLHHGTGRIPPAISGPGRQFCCPPASLAGVISPGPGHGSTGDTYRYLLTWMKTEILGDRLHTDAATGRAKEDVQGVRFTHGESPPL